MGFYSSLVRFGMYFIQEKKIKKRDYHKPYTNKSTSKQYEKSYTSNKKQKFNQELTQFKTREVKKIRIKYKVCSELFFPSKFRASYRFIKEYPDIQQIDHELEYIDTALKEIKTMEKWYAQQKNS